MKKYNSNQWHDLMILSLNGDKKAYRLLLEDIYIWLNIYFSKRIYHLAVEDLVQDTIITIDRKKQTFDPNQSIIGWISIIAKHKHIDYMRKNLKHSNIEFDDNTNLFVCNDDYKYDLSKILKLIPKNYSKIIKLVKIENYSVKDVAKITGNSESKIKILIHRGLIKLKKNIANIDYEF